MENKNLEQNSKNNNLRDYDKEPIILTNYDEVIATTMFLFSFIFGFILFLLFARFFENSSGVYDSVGSEIFFIIILFLSVVLAHRHYNVSKKREIYITNDFISFYDDAKLKRKISINEIDKFLFKPFFRKKSSGEFGLGDKIFFCVVLACVIYAYKFLFIFFIFCIFIGNIIFKFTLLFIINGSLRHFRIFPIVIIAEPQYPNHFLYAGTLVAGSYYFLYIYNNQIYYDIKNWFLTRKNINIDNIKKSYLPL